MAEFDKTGFSAVSAFFGKESATEEPENKKTQKSAVGGRRGVGATLLKSRSIRNDERLSKRLLQVGKRKRNLEDDDEDVSPELQHESDDEEGGRTSIEEKKKPTPVEPVVPAAQKSKKKKKKGKKERKLEAETVENESKDETPTTGTTAENDKDPLVTTTEDTAENTNQTKKKKRKKVRSRQKNIYKDKRLPQHKPEHLILGRSTFAGRPLTAETRARLNLPPSKNSRKHQERQNSHEHYSGNDEESGMGLGIDSFLEDGDNDFGVPNDAHESEKVEKRKKKRKKSKYKNL